MRKWAALAASSAVLVGTLGMTANVTAFASSSNPTLNILAEETASWQDNFNPFVVNNIQVPDGVIYESLFYFSTTGQTYNLLGTGYKWSNGNKTLTVAIRKGVKWNDGKSLTANDVAYSYNVLKKNPGLDIAGLWKAGLISVKALSSTSVQFKFSSVNVPFAQQVLGQQAIIPEHIWSKVADPVKWTDPSPVGTGPYLLNKFSAQDYTLKANPHYWGGKPAAPMLNYPAISANDSATLQLLSGSVDWTDLFIQNINKIFVSKSPSTNHYWFGNNGDVDIYPNLTNSVLKDINVRKAISMAVNRQQITNVGEYGYEPAANPTGLVPSSSKAWIDPSVPKTLSYSVAQANSLLTKAGYAMGADGYRSKNGKELDFNLIAPSGWSDWNEDQQLIQADLKAIGIKVNIQEVQQNDWQNELDSKTYDLALESSYVEQGTTPFYGYYHYLTPSGGTDYEGYNNSAVTNALTKFRTSTNASVQKASMYTIEKAIASDLPVIPLVQAASWYEYSTKDYTGWPTASNPYVDAPPYNGFSTGIVLMHLRPSKK